MWCVTNVAHCIFLMISLIFLAFFIDIHEYANCAITITCIFDHGIKARCLIFNLVQIFVI